MDSSNGRTNTALVFQDGTSGLGARAQRGLRAGHDRGLGNGRGHRTTRGNVQIPFYTAPGPRIHGRPTFRQQGCR